MGDFDISFVINGEAVSFSVPAETKLLYLLRNDLRLNGPKFGCGLGQCGACTVLVDGVSMRSCILDAGDVDGTEVTTLEGLGNRQSPHPLQQAFIDQQAMQCGYCSNGMIMTAAGFLQDNKSPTKEEIKDALAANLCRCGAHQRIIDAVAQCAGESSDDN
ncbi:(2Fe-2S)-binding protein [Emcibacter sp.]|uniref:(2Fe-2S)-binding protein n=1 Tax=Emcibacter sp. TaxID=1979954 RepID=UPI003A8D29F1